MPCRLLIALMLATAFTGIAAQAAEPVRLRASKPVLAHPHDMVLSQDGTLLYVADQNNHAITVLDANMLAVKGTIGKGELSRPHDVAWDKKGRLLVADTGNDRIAFYIVRGSTGRYFGQIKDTLESTEGVTVGPRGNIYATSVRNQAVVEFQGGDLVGLSTWDAPRSLRLSLPHDIAFAPDGRLWVADSGNDRIVIIDPAGYKLIRILDKKTYGFSGVRYFAFDRAGRAYLADKYANRVVILDKSLKIAKVIPNLNNPEGVVTRGKRFWIAETYANRVLLYEWK